MHGLYMILIFAASVAFAAAEAPELVTDRPDQTESAVVVPRGSAQVETGVVYTREGTGTLDYPATLLRVGLAERVELRLGYEGWSKELARNSEAAAFGDGEVGLKLRLWDEAGWLPEAAVLAGITVPFGDEDTVDGRLDPGFRLSFAHSLSERFSFGYNLGVAWKTVDDPPQWRWRLVAPASPEVPSPTIEFTHEALESDTLASFEYTAALGIGLSERWGAFVEVFGSAPINARGGDAHSVDGGFTYLLRPNVQLDISGGIGLNDAAENWFLSTGLSFRLPR